MAMEKKSKAQGQLEKLAADAAARRVFAQQKAVMYDKGIASKPKSAAAHVRQSGNTPIDNTKGQFMTGPLKPGESRTYSRAKRDVLKQEMAKRSAAAKAAMAKKPGETEAQYQARKKTMTYGNPNQ